MARKLVVVRVSTAHIPGRLTTISTASVYTAPTVERVPKGIGAHE